MPRASTLTPLAGSWLPIAYTASRTRKIATCCPSISAAHAAVGNDLLECAHMTPARRGIGRRGTRCAHTTRLSAARSSGCARPRLAALLDERTMPSSACSLLMKCRKRRSVCGSLDRVPSIRTRTPIHHALHIGFELGGDAQTILAHHVLQVVQSALEVVAPHRGALQPIGGADVEHQKTVDVADQRRPDRDPRPAAPRGVASCRRCRRRTGSSPSRSRSPRRPCSAPRRIRACNPIPPNLSLCGERRPL